MTTSFHPKQSRRFLETLYETIDDGYIEFRFIAPETPPVQSFYSLPLSYDDICNEIEEYIGTRHIFFGVNPRTEKSGTQEAIQRVCALWVDVDGKDLPGGKAEAYDILTDFSCEPTILVDSGNGFHSYYQLEQPYQIDSECDRDYIYNLNRKLHRHLRADSTHSLDHILRLPGTPNPKKAPDTQEITNDPSQWTPCEIRSINFTRYTTKQLDRNIPDEPTVERNQRIEPGDPERITDEATLKRIVDASVLERARDMPMHLENDRSENDFWVATQLYEQGLNDGDVLEAFRIFRDLEWDAGKKFDERGEDYLLKYTLPNAKSQANRADQIVQQIEQTENSSQQLQLIKNALREASSMEPLEQESLLDQVYDAAGGKSGPITKRAMRKQVSEEDRDGFNAVFFGEEVLDDHDYLWCPQLDQLFHYEHGVYESVGMKHLRNVVLQKLGPNWNTSKRKEVQEWVKDRTAVDRSELGHPRHMINVKNGMVNVRTGELKPHAPQYKSTRQFDVEYDPEAYNEETERVIQEILPENAQTVWWEHCGYILAQDLLLKKFLVLVGPSYSGKSTLLNTIEHVVGAENAAHQELQRLSSNRFAPAHLYNKVVNTAADLPKNPIDYVGKIKELTGGDTISARFKGANDFTFTNRSRLFFSTNTLPPVKGADNAFFKRLHVIRCPNVFDETDEHTESNIDAKIMDETGKSYWLNKAIEGAQRLYENDNFTRSEHVARQIVKYRTKSDSVSEFLHKHIRTANEDEENDDLWEAKDDLYKAYRKWCNDFGRAPCSRSEFGKRAKKPPNSLRDFHPVDPRSGNQVSAWWGIRLKERSQEKYGGFDIER